MATTSCCWALSPSASPVTEWQIAGSTRFVTPPDQQVVVSSPAVDIRPATHDDVPEMAALYRAAYDTLGDLGFPSSMQTEDGSRLREWLDTREMFVAEQHDDTLDVVVADQHENTPTGAADSGRHLVGAVHLIPHDDWPCPELGRLAVHPNYHESGVGTRLREHVEATARDRGHDCIRLRTFTDHPFLRDWYERAGYEKCGNQELDSRPYDLHILEKDL